MSTQEFDVVVIGGGPAGYPAAFRAADLGLKVALVDPEANPGGVCLYRGCIPSKALLHIAALINETIHSGSTFGVSFDKPKIDIDKVRTYKNNVIKKMTSGLGMLSKARNISFIRGTAKFNGKNSVEVTDNKNQTSQVSFKNAIIATGSRPTVIPSLDLKSPNVMDSTGALELKKVPNNLLCLGGGIIGMEIATVYSALGSDVSIVEMMPNLLGLADPELTAIVMKTVKPRLKEVMVETKVNQMKETAKGIVVTMEDKNGTVTKKTYEQVLVCIGRVPNSQNLGLEHLALSVSKQGFIEVDEQCRTKEPHIFAIGDIVGQPMLAHKGTHEGHVAAETIAGKKVRFDPRTIPSVVYTDPELAWCGLTEQEAKDKGLNFEVAKFPWAASGRATALGRTDGLTKLLFDKETGQVIGVGIVGVGAGELIGEGVLAVEMGANAKDIAHTIHPHPTTTETIMEAAELFLGHCDHYIAPKKK